MAVGKIILHDNIKLDTLCEIFAQQYAQYINPNSIQIIKAYLLDLHEEYKFSDFINNQFALYFENWRTRKLKFYIRNTDIVKLLDDQIEFTDYHIIDYRYSKVYAIAKNVDTLIDSHFLYTLDYVYTKRYVFDTIYYNSLQEGYDVLYLWYTNQIGFDELLAKLELLNCLPKLDYNYSKFRDVLYYIFAYHGTLLYNAPVYVFTLMLDENGQFKAARLELISSFTSLI